MDALLHEQLRSEIAKYEHLVEAKWKEQQHQQQQQVQGWTRVAQEINERVDIASFRAEELEKQVKPFKRLEPRNSNGTFKVAIRQMFTRVLGWGVLMALVSKSVESVLDTCGVTQVGKAPSHGAAPFAQTWWS